MSQYEVFLGLGPRGDFPEGYLRELINGRVRDPGYTLRYHTRYAFVDCCNDGDAKALESLGGFRAGSSVMQARCEERNRFRNGGGCGVRQALPPPPLHRGVGSMHHQQGGGQQGAVSHNDGSNYPPNHVNNNHAPPQQRGFRALTDNRPGEKRERAPSPGYSEDLGSDTDSLSSSSASERSARRRRHKLKREKKKEKRHQMKDEETTAHVTMTAVVEHLGSGGAATPPLPPPPTNLPSASLPPAYTPKTMEELIESFYHLKPQAMDTIKIHSILKCVPLREGVSEADIPSIELFALLTDDAKSEIIKKIFTHDLSLVDVTTKLSRAPAVAASKLLTVFQDLLVGTEDDWLGSGAYPPSRLTDIPHPIIRKLDATAMVLYNISTSAPAAAPPQQC